MEEAVIIVCRVAMVRERRVIMNVYVNMTKKAELLALQELYNDICFGNGVIEPDESGLLYI